MQQNYLVMWASSTLSLCELVIEICLGKKLGFPFADWGQSQVEGKKMFYIGAFCCIGPLKYCQNRVYKNSNNAILLEKVEESSLMKTREWLRWCWACLVVLKWIVDLVMSVFTGCVISCFSAFLLKVHATHLPIRQKLIKIILQLCYQMVWGICFGFSNMC